ncbi:MAG: hypothetical protein K2H93_01495 [Oscillospiraceae bacterium]|nr:hypothetical protein [Oscillospiraceae bacterium]
MKKIYLGAVMIVLTCLTACKQEQKTELDNNNNNNNNQIIETSENNDSDIETELKTEDLQETQPINVHFSETDFNAHTFNDGKFDFVQIVNDDACAEGKLSVENIDENFMLKFTDLSTNAENLDNTMQKICISVDKLLNPDQLESVFAIGFDSYAQAKDNLNIESNIFISGETVCMNDEWYHFEEVSVSESNAYHVELKFAESDMRWDSSQETVNLIITCSGMQTISDWYLDNIIFYDQEGNTIPLNPSY